MSIEKRRMNLNVGLNSTGYLANAWKYRSGGRHDINDPAYYRRLAEIARKGLFDAVFFSAVDVVGLFGVTNQGDRGGDGRAPGGTSEHYRRFG